MAASPVAKLAAALVNSWSKEKSSPLKFLPYPEEFEKQPNVSPETAKILIGLVNERKIHPKFFALIAPDLPKLRELADLIK